MSKKGFYIKFLCMTGKNVDDAFIEFKQSLNVISGASDTGKSYLLECIEYMFGGQEPPKSIEQDGGYDTIKMEISTYSGSLYTLVRSLKLGGDFKVYNCSHKDIEETTEYETLKCKPTKEHGDNSLPDFLLSLSNLANVTIQTNKTDAKRKLHFSDIRHFTIIDEFEIINTKTPLWPTRQFTTRTADFNVFKYIISGEDASSLIVAPKALSIRKTEWKVKKQTYTELIEELKFDIDNIRGSSPIAHDVNLIENSLKESVKALNSTSKEVEELNNKKLEIRKKLRNHNSRMEIIDQLKKRFDLLLKHYNADLDRLSFISESDHYLSQLGSAHCPYCGLLMENHKDAKDVHENIDNIQESANSEKAKIANLILDLEITTEQLNLEKKEREEKISQLRTEIDFLNREVSEQLKPRINFVQSDIDKLIEYKNRLNLVDIKVQRMDFLQKELDSIGEEPKRTRSKAKDKVDSTTTRFTMSRRTFSDAVENRLRAWNFPSAGTVEFSPSKDADIIINGKSRSSFGKGYRAIIQTAFTISLMDAFEDRHPGLVVIDSPLTSYKEKDGYEASDDIQAAFYENLSNTPKHQQIIIFENKDPRSKTVTEKINYHHFSGSLEIGRQGFY